MVDDPKGEPCQRCGEYCVGHMGAKCSDGFFMTWPGGREQSGYVPPDDISGVRAGGSEDYMEVDLCLACGQVQGKWPKKSVVKWLERGSRPTAEDAKPRPKPKRKPKKELPPEVMCLRCKTRPADPEDGQLCVPCLDNKAFAENWTD